MPNPLHYVTYFQKLSLEEVFAVLLGRFSFSFLLWVGIAVSLFLGCRACRRRRKAIAESSPPETKPGPAARPGFLLLLFVASLMFNLFRIGQESLSSMEGTYLSEAATNQTLVGAIFNRHGIVNSHLPLYRVLVHLTTYLGDSVPLLRGVSALFGALSVPVLYLFLGRLFSRYTAALAALLFLLSPVQVYFSQNCMPYSLLAFLVLLYSHAFLLLWQRPTGKAGLFYVVTMAAGLNAHALFLGALVAPFLCQLHGLLRERHDRAVQFRFLLYLEKSLLAGFFLLPFLLLEMFFLTFFSSDFTQYMAYLEVVPPIAELAPRSALFFTHLVNLVAGIEGGSAGTALALGAVFAAASLYLLAARGALAFLLVPGPCFALVLMQFLGFTYLQQVFFEVRYFCFVPALFWGTLLGAAGTLEQQWGPGERLRFLPRTVRQHLCLTLLALLCAVPSLHTLRDLFTRLDNPDFRAVTGFLRQALEDGDALSITPASFFGDVVIYHLHEPRDGFRQWQPRINSFELVRLPRAQGEVSYFCTINNRFLPWEEASRNLFFRRIWLVNVNETTLGFPEYSDRPFLRVKKDYDASFERLGQWSFAGIDLYLYKPAQRLPGLDAGSFTLKLGRDDYPYIQGFVPSAIAVAPCRGLTTDAGIRIPVTDPNAARGVNVTLSFTAGEEVCPSRRILVGYSLYGVREHREYDLARGAGPGEFSAFLEPPAGAGGPGMLEITFEPVPGGAAGGGCLPGLCVSELAVESATK